MLSDFSASGFYVLRTPLLPWNVLRAWSGERENPRLELCERMSQELLKSAWCMESWQLRDRLDEIVRRPEVLEALFIASPSLVRSLSHWRRSPESRSGKQTERSLIRYLCRLTTRSTPVGLCAGTSVGEIRGKEAGPHLRFPSLSPIHEYRRKTHVDAGILCQWSRRWQKHPYIRNKLRFRLNSSLCQVAGRWHYVERHWDNGGFIGRVSALTPDPYLNSVLGEARKGRTIAELTSHLAGEFPSEVTSNDAREYIHDLIHHQALVSDLEPALSGSAPLTYLLETCRELEALDALDLDLEQIAQDLRRLDSEGIGQAPEAYTEIHRKIREDSTESHDRPPIYVDLFKPLLSDSLPGDLVGVLLHGAELLRRTQRASTPKNTLESFRQAFLYHYAEGRMVRLMEALDDEVGIGYSPALRSRPLPPLLRGLELPVPSIEQDMTWQKRDAFLLRRIQGLTDSSQLELSSEDLEILSFEPLPDLPDAFHLMTSLIAPCRKTQNRFRILLHHLEGPSGVHRIGRLAHSEPRLKEETRTHVAKEEALRPDLRFAEIVHLPDPRQGSLLSRPRFRDLEIPYLGKSEAEGEDVLPVSDLWVTVKDHRVVLFSESLQQEILPRLTVSHNYVSVPSGVYPFLCALQNQVHWTWDWGPLAETRHLPRVTCGRIVLARERWNLTESEVRRLTETNGLELLRAAEDLRSRYGLPRQVFYQDGDRELWVDFRNPLVLESFVALIRGRKIVHLVESNLTTDDPAVRGPEGGFLHELIVPFVKNSRPSDPTRIAERSVPPSLSQEDFLPGSPWLFARLFVGVGLTDRLVIEMIAPTARRIMQKQWADRWFFVRHDKPKPHLGVYFHGEPSTLIHEVLPILATGCDTWKREGRMARLQLDTYRRESFRCGGAEAIELAEQIFWADSDAAAQILMDLRAEPSSRRPRWFLTLQGILRLLEDFFEDDWAMKLRIARRLRRAYTEEFNADTQLRRQIGRKHRQAKPRLRALWREDRTDRDPISWILRQRSERMSPSISAYRNLAQSKRLTVPLEDVVAHFVHMSVLRMLTHHHRLQELLLYDFLYRSLREGYEKDENNG